MTDRRSSRALDIEAAGVGEAWPSRFLRWLVGTLDCGRLSITAPDGERVTVAGRAPGPDGALTLHRWRAVRRLLTGGDLAFAEAFIDGDWSSPDLPVLIELVACNEQRFGAAMAGLMLSRVANRLRHARNRNSRTGSRRNIMAHYDLGNAFYAAFLDPGMTYSSALYEGQAQTLEQAQAAKLDAVVAALDLRPGQRVLEIGCGWGTLAARMASMGCTVTAITLSPAQLDLAGRRLAAAGLADRAELRLQDYRDVEGRFDRIVSVEMIEAVGQRYWPTFFGCLRDRLAPEGVAVLQAITIDDRKFASYARSPDYIQRYVFPGGMLPCPAVIGRQAQNAGLSAVRTLRFGASYARTLAEWRRRFHAAWPQIGPLGFDTRFFRLWDYYLAYCEGGFRSGITDVSLWQLSPEAPR